MGKVNHRSFFVQIKRFAGALAEQFRDIFAYNRKLFSRLVLFSFLGPTIQASSLALVLHLTRDLGKSGSVETVAIGPFMVSMETSLVVIIALLCLSIYFLYEAERLVSYIATQYANRRCAEFIAYHPYISHKMDDIYLDDDRMVSSDLVNRLREYARVLTLSTRVILRMPTAVLYAVYGSAFLFYLEPLLTAVLILVLSPLALPLRRFTRDITRYERERRKIGNKSRSELTSLIQSTGDLPSILQASLRQLVERYSQTAVAESNNLGMMRRISLARSKAIANVALALTIGISAFYFFIIQNPATLSLPVIITYFIALRLATVGGKQFIGYVAKFARFYNKTHFYLVDRLYAEKRIFRRDVALVIEGPNLEATGRNQINVEPGVPLAIVGKGRLGLANLGKVAIFRDPSGSMERGDIVAGMYMIPDKPCLHADMSWRDFFALEKSASHAQFVNRAATVCCNIDIKTLCRSLDQPLPVTEDSLSLEERVDLLLLLFHLSPKSILILPAVLCRKLDPVFLDAWLVKLEDRYIGIYYQPDSLIPFCQNERMAAVIDADGNVMGFASGTYWENNPQRLDELMQADEQNYSERKSRSADIFEDDEED